MSKNKTVQYNVSSHKKPTGFFKNILTKLKCVQNTKNEMPFKFSKAFSHNVDLTRKQIDQTGFISHFGLTQEPALFIHTADFSDDGERLFVYNKGITLNNLDIAGNYKVPQFLCATELVSAIKNDFNLDLCMNGNTGNMPLHLVSCYAGGKGPYSLASQLASATGRGVIAYGNKQELITMNDIKRNLSEDACVYAYPLHENNELNTPLPGTVYHPVSSVVKKG